MSTRVPMRGEKEKRFKNKKKKKKKGHKVGNGNFYKGVPVVGEKRKGEKRAVLLLRIRDSQSLDQDPGLFARSGPTDPNEPGSTT
jgi:hypothetical protein